MTKLPTAEARASGSPDIASAGVDRSEGGAAPSQPRDAPEVGARPARHGHRVVIEFDDGVRAKLICPESGCVRAQNCAQCGRDLHPRDEAEQREEGIEPCDDCKDAETWGHECWIKTWFDNVGADELLAGKVTVEIDAKWDFDHMVAHIIDPELFELA
jgi:hypothetical protein